ncbi:acyl-CoA dehydrogenase family protein [uncultured Pseudacidovorax sp.]|uniref:acyl-CoA dehydrogenase family protein n=1 Tax=uncultured Pseudacidovorax sp. TaxID=679313 RepID=UPI0025FA50FC|nr:acyl-CoA dehydrogenase family protein [uncultured Pseudacidovorax sp.]
MSALPQTLFAPALDGVGDSPAPLRAAPRVDDATLAALTRRFATTAADHDQAGRFPHDNFDELQRLGLIGLVAPEAWGGGGATLAEARRVITAVAAGEPATALVLTMTYLQHQALRHPANRWPAHLREAVARSGVREGALANALRVEPALGSPARGGLPGTVARREGKEWVIDGHKLYTTGIERLSWLLVWGRTDEPAPRTGFFLVPGKAPGIRTIASWDHLGLRASGSHEAVLEGVRIPLDHAVDIRVPAHWAPAAATAAEAKAFANQQAWMATLLGSLYDAVAGAARDWLLGFLQSRAPGSLGAPLATLPRVQEKVGEIQALLRTNRVLLNDLAARTDAGQVPTPADSGLVKHTVGTQAIAAVELALQLSGNHGLARQNPLERHHRDVLCARIHTPQSDAALVAAGQQALAAAGRAAPDRSTAGQAATIAA